MCYLFFYFFQYFDFFPKFSYVKIYRAYCSRVVLSEACFRPGAIYNCTWKSVDIPLAHRDQTPETWVHNTPKQKDLIGLD